MSTVPIVRAIITLYNELVNPVMENESFEVRDNSPGDAVYRCPPWETNNGGWRELRGDVNGDGYVDVWDMSIVSRAYGCAFGETGYNPDADLNGSGLVDIMDLSMVSKEYGRETNRIDGSYCWYTSGGGDYYMWQYLENDAINGAKGQQVAFTFWFLPESVAPDGSQNYARAEIYYEHSGHNNTVYGDWVHPDKPKWYNALVMVDLIPYDTELIKVVIHGKPDFKAYVDLVSFSIYDYVIKPCGKGDLALAVNILQWETKDVEPGFPDGLALVSAGLYAERWGNYRIRKIQLKAELFPNDGSSSTQQGGLQIWYSGQANDDGWQVDPAAVEQFENLVFSSSELAIKVIAGAAVGVLTRHPLSFVVTTYVGTVAQYMLGHFRSDPLDPTANTNLDPTDYFILERWDYPDSVTHTDPDIFVDSATGHYGFEWQFFTESTTHPEIVVTASVNWGWPMYVHPNIILVDYGWTDVSTSIIINT